MIIPNLQKEYNVNEANINLFIFVHFTNRFVLIKYDICIRSVFVYEYYMLRIKNIRDTNAV